MSVVLFSLDIGRNATNLGCQTRAAVCPRIKPRGAGFSGFELITLIAFSQPGHSNGLVQVVHAVKHVIPL